MYDLEDRLGEIASKFPTLRKVPFTGCEGQGRYDAFKLDEWAAERIPQLSSGTLGSIRFILYLWDGTREWKSGRFWLRRSWGIWDSEHRAAWQAWATEPWWA